MDEVKLFKVNLLLLVAVIALITICYFYIDRPVACWLSEQGLRAIKLFKYLSQIPEIFIIAVPFILLISVMRYSFNKMNQSDRLFLLFATTIAITQFVKDLLKYVFGRTWPETWCHNPSLIHDGVYGFHFFTKSVAYSAFPSGHAATLFAGLSMLWLLLPRFRWLYTIIGLLALIGIQAMNYHFVSDIIGGALLGYLIAVYAYSIYNSTPKLK